MPNVVVGGVSYELAGLRLADVRALSKSGCLKRLATLGTLEPWEQIETAAEVVSASILRGGGKLSTEELLDSAAAQELTAIIAAVTAVMTLSGFDQARGAEGPNAPSPTPSTSGG
jgi:hypothetical protein